MKERIQEFLTAENKSSAQFAEEIGVQPSGISHILSGRNNPSLDFVLKMLEKYKFISTEWLLFGRGTMYKNTATPTLFDNNNLSGIMEDNRIIEQELKKPLVNELKFKDENNEEIGIKSSDEAKITAKSVEKIVWFFDDSSFKEYFPSGRLR